MRIFKKKKSIGKGKDEIVFLQKEIEALNYTPVDYMYTEKYANFLRNMQKQFHGLIESTSPDDLCESMLDGYIDSVTREMKASAREQYTNHMHLLAHYKGIIDGKLTKGRRRLENLEQDLCSLEAKRQQFQKLQKNI